MNLYPAIDIMDGKCVRLVHGDKLQRTTYSNEPADMAVRWRDAGARWLHVIDLDAAIEQKPLANLAAVEKILARVEPDGIKVQAGGGIRSSEHIRTLLASGASRVIVGTKIFESAEFAKDIFAEFGDRVAAALDGRDGRVAVKGWLEATDITIEDAAETMQDLGARILIVTDIGRDGTLTEPNFDLMDRVCRRVNIGVIASGGVSLVAHIDRLAALGHANLDGAIVGKALYEGQFDLEEAVRRFQENRSSEFGVRSSEKNK